jgi:outer membrane protein assembly factor BamB
MRPRFNTVFRPGFFLLLQIIFAAAAITVSAEDWPQWLGPRRDGVWRETGILKEFPTNGLKFRWRAPVGAGYSGPSVAEGRVFLTDRQLAPKTSNPSDPFHRGMIAGSERVLCFNEADGKLLWKHEYDCPYDVSYPAGPRASPIIAGGKVYTLGTEGNLFCLEAASGKVLWSREFKKEFGISTPLWGFAGHPLIDGQKLICLAGGQGSVAVAFDKDTGKELWRALSAKEPGYAPPMIYEFGGKPQLIVWHPESINALEPQSGKLIWSQAFPVRSALSIPTPRQVGEQLFVTCFYDGPILLRPGESNSPAVVWQGKGKNERNTDGLHSIISTPFIDEGYIYGVCSYGQLRCLKAATGERVWETLAATTGGKEERWANAFLIKNGDRFFLANEKGDLILARLTPAGYQEIGRTQLLKPTNTAAGREVVWSHPAFANRCIYARNDVELVCASLRMSPEAGVIEAGAGGGPVESK